jgi:hypothetical protein
MATFVLTYRRPKNYTVGTADGMAAWNAFFEGMGDSLVELGKPVSESVSVGDCGKDLRDLGGFSLVTADDLQGAIALAEKCPFIGQGGGVEIGQLADLPGAAETA